MTTNARRSRDRDNETSGRVMRWLGVTIGATLIAVIASVIASSGKVSDREESVFHAINDLPDWLEVPMWVFQLAGLLLVPILAAIPTAFMRRWRLAAALAVFVPLKLLVEKAVVKQLVERDRPGTTICGAPDHFDPSCANFRDVPLEGNSFVSGHAVIAWGVVALAWPVLPARWRWVSVAIATLAAIARVYLGAHNPLDVIGGAAVGIAVGALLVVVFDPLRDRDLKEPSIHAHAK